MTPYPERCIVTLNDMSNEPGRVQGVLALGIEGTTAECTLVARGHSGQPRAMHLRGYPVCLEPLSALVIRLLLSAIDKTASRVKATSHEDSRLKV